jgi:hypothetical protein
MEIGSGNLRALPEESATFSGAALDIDDLLAMVAETEHLVRKIELPPEAPRMPRRSAPGYVYFVECP